MRLGFNPSYILDAPLWVQIHLAASLFALVLGTMMWLRPKGTGSHKLIGKFFMLVMFVSAFTAIFIRDINDGQFSFIHIFVPVTFLGIYNALKGIRRKNLKRHISATKGLYFGALLIPGLLSFMPGRRMFALFFG